MYTLIEEIEVVSQKPSQSPQDAKNNINSFKMAYQGRRPDPVPETYNLFQPRTYSKRYYEDVDDMYSNSQPKYVAPKPIKSDVRELIRNQVQQQHDGRQQKEPERQPSYKSDQSGEDIKNKKLQEDMILRESIKKTFGDVTTDQLSKKLDSIESYVKKISDNFSDREHKLNNRIKMLEQLIKGIGLFFIILLLILIFSKK
jgi:hypothetical protein